MSTATRPRRFVGTGDERVVIPAGVKLPTEVRKANDRLRDAHDRLVRSKAELRAARDGITQAQQADNAAARSAANAGKAAPERAEPQAHAAVAEAERRVQAHEGAVIDTSRELAIAIAEARPDWLPAQREAVEQSKAAALEVLDGFVSALDQITADEAVLAGLEEFGDGGSLIGVVFTPGNVQRQRDRKLEKQRIAVESNPSTQVPRDLHSLLGALRLVVEGHKREPLVIGPGGDMGPGRASW